MKKIVYLLSIIAPFLMVGCGDSEIDTWNSSMAWFKDSLVNFTNMTQPDVPLGGTLRIPVPISVAADMSNHDRVVNIEVVANPSDSRTKVEVPTTAIIRANHTTDTLYVSLINSSHLDEVYDTLAIKVIPSADFQPGLPAYQMVKICLHNGYLKPSWWDDEAEWSLGYFTQLKMKIFETVIGNLDDPRGNKAYWDPYGDIQLYYNIYILNDYVQQNDIRYPDDDPNAPDEQPYFGGYSY